MGLAIKGTSSNEMIQAVDTALLINRLTGTNLFPWEVADIPEEWLHLLITMNFDLPKMKKAIGKNQALKDKIVAGHKTYKPIPPRK